MYHHSPNKPSLLTSPQDDDYSLQICSRLVDHIDAILTYWDKKEVCRFGNNSFFKLFASTHKHIVGKITMKELFGASYFENKAHIKKVLEGKKQIFELELKFPGDAHHYYIVTYTPDKIKGKVIGFFAHMADVSLIKMQDTKRLDSEKAKRRDVLRSVIETQENERELIAYELRDKVNQTLAFSKMMLGSTNSKNNSAALLARISRNIHETIDELNRISTDLTPSVITMIGFQPGVKEYINTLKKRYPARIVFKCLAENIEALSVKDKVSIFRLIQNYLLILLRNTTCKNVSITVKQAGMKLSLVVKHDSLKFEMPSQSKEFLDIEHRLEYYNGSLKHTTEKNKKVLSIDLDLPA